MIGSFKQDGKVQGFRTSGRRKTINYLFSGPRGRCDARATQQQIKGADGGLCSAGIPRPKT